MKPYETFECRYIKSLKNRFASTDNSNLQSHILLRSGFLETVNDRDRRTIFNNLYQFLPHMKTD